MNPCTVENIEPGENGGLNVTFRAHDTGKQYIAHIPVEHLTAPPTAPVKEVVQLPNGEVADVTTGEGDDNDAEGGEATESDTENDGGDNEEN